MTTSVADAFNAVRDKYKIAQGVIDWLLKADGLNAASLEDFIYAAADEKEVSTLVDAMGLDANIKALQTARVRQAWVALRKSKAEEEAIKKRGLDDTDLDTLLPQPQLDDIADVFFRRYRVTYPAYVTPSDMVVSRLSKELEKRALTMRDIWKVKSQAQFQRANRKKTSIGGGVDILAGIEEIDTDRHDLQTYLDKLLTLLIGYAVVGAKQLTTAPQTEKRGGQTIEVVEVPLDVVTRYYFRASRFAHQCHYSQALSYLTKRDEEEREMWVDYYRNGDRTLGATIVRVYEMREAMWQPPDPPAKPTVSDSDRKRQRDRDGGTPKGKGKGTKKQREGNDESKFAKQFKNGTKLCAAYQTGACSDKNCQKGQHLCAMMLSTGRVCGLRHPASRCLNKRRVTG